MHPREEGGRDEGQGPLSPLSSRAAAEGFVQARGATDLEAAGLADAAAGTACGVFVMGLGEAQGSTETVQDQGNNRPRGQVIS